MRRSRERLWFLVGLSLPATTTMARPLVTAISDGFYGNEPNIVGPFAPGGPAEQEPGTKGGRVVASQSPGPKVTNPDGSVRPGASVGDVHKQFGGGVVPAFCREATNTPS